MIQFYQYGVMDYHEAWTKMRDFTMSRTDAAADEIWALEHPPVYTLGLAGKSTHILTPPDAPIVRTDRGGQVTYHGPGQLVFYTLLDLRRLGLGARRLVDLLEQAVIDYLAEHRIDAIGAQGVRGVYTPEGKIASIGLRVRRGCCYHGVSLNVDVEPGAFDCINVCGEEDIAISRLIDYGVAADKAQVANDMFHHLRDRLSAPDSSPSAQSPQSRRQPDITGEK